VSSENTVITVTWRRATRPGSLTEATEEATALLGTAVGFVSTPTTWASVQLGELSDELAGGAYEVRWFGDAGEVRWLRRGDGGAIAIVEVRTDDPEGDAWSSADALIRRYRCWGQVRSVDPDGRHAVIGEARIAPQRMALSAGHEAPSVGDVLTIEALELLSADADGNTYVLDEVLWSVRRRHADEDGNTRPPKGSTPA
jgi:hypothetical protein